MTAGRIANAQNGEYIAACVVCKEQKPVLLYPHRLEGRVVGWVFVCESDQAQVVGADVSISLRPKAHVVTLGANPDA